MNLTYATRTELQDEIDLRDGCFYRGAYKHKKGCDSSSVNPITEWCGGSEVMITGYKCPRCGMVTRNKQC